ncbi:MAG: hypothetical protein WD768_21175 [Phycisphaeraceae bacterium]
MHPRIAPSKPVAAPAPSPVPEAVIWTTWVLRIAIALQCVGMALPMVTHQTPSPLNEYLLNHQGVEDATAGMIDQVTGFAMFGIAVVVLVFPISPIVLLVAAWAGVTAWATQMNEGDAFAFVAVPAQAVRFIAPLALVLLLAWPGHYARAAWRQHGAMWLLRLAAAVVFIAHGYEAFALNPRFIDYILHSGQFFFATTFPQQTAEWLLRLIGVQDVILAVALIGAWPNVKHRRSSWRIGHRVIVGLVAAISVYQLERFREPRLFVDWIAGELSHWLAMPVAGDALVLLLAVAAGLVAMSCVVHWRGLIIYMACWGLITAAARVIDGGFVRIDEMLIRACNAAAPLAVLLLVQHFSQTESAAATNGAKKKRPTAPGTPGASGISGLPSRPAPRPSQVTIHSEESTQPAAPRRPI